MPEALVHRLEAVDVEHEHGEPVVGPPGLEGHGLPDPVHEQRAVGKARQSVVEGVVEELLLGLLALGDVRLRSGHPGRLAGGVADRDSAQEHRPPGPVRVADAVLHLELGGPPLDVRGDVRGEARVIVGMHAP